MTFTDANGPLPVYWTCSTFGVVGVIRRLCHVSGEIFMVKNLKLLQVLIYQSNVTLLNSLA